MQFGEFIFPHNPHKINVSYKNNLAVNFLPFKGEKSESLGNKLREIKCYGSFYGENPIQSQKDVESFLRNGDQTKSSLLFIPGLEPFPAFLKECSIDWIDDGKVVPYTLIFTEEGGLYS